MYYEELDVLVAVSVPELSESVCDFLKSRNVASVQSAVCMNDALDHMLASTFSVIIVDGQLRVSAESGRRIIAGVDFIRFIRMCEGPTSDAHVIFFRSGKGCLDLVEAENEVMEAEKAGVTCIFPQPFSEERFIKIAEPLILHSSSFFR